jgi:hypothetical protein
VQAIDSIEETPNRSEIPKIPALQDSLPPLELILTGLIAHLFGFTLQDGIDITIRRLVQIGLDITNRSHHHHENYQASAVP